MVRKYLSALLLGGATLAFAALLHAQGARTLTGTVSDAMCGKDHGGKPPVACTHGCVKKGSDYALVVGDKVYTLKGKADDLDKLAGAKAKVTGKVSGDTITVDKVEAGG